MKIGQVQESKESVSRKLYTGVAPVKVLLVNPSKDELEKEFGWKVDKEPVYTGEKDGVRWVNITLYTRPDIEGVEDILPVKFFLRDTARLNSAGNKCQCVNAYGETVWLSQEDYDNCVIPGNMNFSPEGVRQAYSGEDSLLEFIRTHLNVPSRMYMTQDKEWKEIEDPETALLQLERIGDYFSGDVSEVVEALSLFPDNCTRVWFGVQKDSNNNNYQTFFPAKFGRKAARNCSFILNNITRCKAAGMYRNVEFGDEVFKEYTETPTTFKAPETKAATVEEVKSKWVKK